MSALLDVAPEHPGMSRDRLLSAEANHRIANSLSAIAGLVRQNAAGSDGVRPPESAEDLRDLLDDIGSRIDTVARLHRLLATSRGDREIALPPFLLEIAEATLAANARAGAMVLDAKVPTACAIPADMALAAGLIVGELVSNAVKYAHPAGVPGKIELSCRSKDGGIVIEVADDGVGLPQGLNPRGAMTTGFKLMRGLAHELGADLSFHQDGIGLRARLVISAISLAFAYEAGPRQSSTGRA